MKEKITDSERLYKLLDYDFDTGLLMWKIRNSVRCKKGWFSGTLCRDKNNYLFYRIKIDGYNYRVSHVIWALVKGDWPENEIDHRDGNPLNNRFNNLRPATTLQNGFNKRPRGEIGLKGVVRKGSRYQAMIAVNGAKIYLGLFKSKEEAALAYQKAAELHQGIYAYHKRGENAF